MPSTAIIVVIGILFCICIIFAVVGIYFATQSSGSPSGSPPSGSPSGSSPDGSSPGGSPGGSPAAFSLTASGTSPSYGLSGYKPVPLANLPATFTLKNTSTGKYWGWSNDQVTDGGTTAKLSADAPTDLYNATGTNTYRLQIQGSPGYVRHAGYVMWNQPYAAQNYDFTWQIFLKDGTADQVAIWNPYPGNGTGYWVTAGTPTAGRQQISQTTSPTVFTLAPWSSSTATSSYVPEPYSLV